MRGLLSDHSSDMRAPHGWTTASVLCCILITWATFRLADLITLSWLWCRNSNLNVGQKGFRVINASSVKHVFVYLDMQPFLSSGCYNCLVIHLLRLYLWKTFVDVFHFSPSLTVNSVSRALPVHAFEIWTYISVSASNMLCCNYPPTKHSFWGISAR